MYSTDLRSNGFPCEVLSPKEFRYLAISKKLMLSFVYFSNMVRTIFASSGTITGGLCFEGDFEYRVHIQGSGWTDWTKADGVATLGTVGQELRIEAIQFR